MPQLRFYAQTSHLGRYRFDPKQHGPNAKHPFVIQNPKCDKFRVTMAYLIERIGQEKALQATTTPGRWYFVDGAVL